MSKLCTVCEVRDAEAAAVRDGRSESHLMSQAGSAIAEHVANCCGSAPGKAVFLIGPGNNGGDGLVAASVLAAQGWECNLRAFSRDGIGDAPVSAESGKAMHWIGGTEALRDSMNEADLIVDAVFGIGGKPQLPNDVAEAFRLAYAVRINRGTPLWSIDVPSGVDADTGTASDDAFHADRTLSIGLPKVGLYRTPGLRYAGNIDVIDIGLVAPEPAASDVVLITESWVRHALPRRRQDTHKHDVGWLMVVGGAPNYFGAPRMAAEAAMRAGAGMVCLAVPRSLVAPIASAVREATFLPLPDAEFGGAGDRMAKLVKDRMPEFAAMLIGPGLGQDDPVPEFLSRLFGLQPTSDAIGFGALRAHPSTESFTGNAVIDADGLNWLAKQDRWQDSMREAELVLTPHPGELSRLTGKSIAEIAEDPWTAARDAAETFQQVVVLKQAYALVAAPGTPLMLSPRCQPALASAGTGDVLAGTIAGLLAQGMAVVDAAAAGLFIGSNAADLAVARVGTLSLVAGDVIGALPQAIQTLYDRNW